jgi:uncharacterized membrane protein
MQRRRQDWAAEDPWTTDQRWTTDSRGRDAPAGGDSLARALGVFSLALGFAQVAAPRKLVHLIGVRDTDRNRDTMVGIGLREIASGLGILGRSQPAGWLQARVGGDVMDLALLARALQSDHENRERVATAIAAVAGVMALDTVAARRWARTDDGNGGDGATGPERLQGRGPEAAARHGRPVTRSITVRQSPEEVYTFWRQLENLPRFMEHLESVRTIDDRHSHWRAKGPAGTSFEWDAEIVTDRPNELIAWRSMPGSTVPNSGQVRFVRAPGERGTEVHVELTYSPPAGKLGVVVAKLLGEEPAQQVASDLSRFKQVLETGEVIYSDASIHRTPHPAQPTGPQVASSTVDRDETKGRAS